ncbi:MAG: hypothetical protein ACOC1S_05260, partial [bacterium]
KYDPPLKNKKDFDKLTLPDFTYNKEKTEKQVEIYSKLIGDILPVRVRCNPPLGATICTYAANLRGLSQMMMDMAAEPELIIRLMEYLKNSVLRAMEQVESYGILTTNNHGPMYCSDNIGDKTRDQISYKHLWCAANSQEFDQVSPTMWEKFLLDYQLPILNKFGLVSYGCCEDLTKKMDKVLSIPNLRIFVCSAWTDLDLVLEKAELDYTIMWRQKATDVVFNDLEDVKKDLEEGARKLKGHYYQIVLRELEALNGDYNRLHKWTKLAKEVATQ